MKERVWKTIVCVILSVSVLSLSVSVFAVDTTPEPTSTIPPIEEMNQVLWDESGAYLMWTYLASMGIIIADNPETMEYTIAVQDLLTEYVLEFLSQLPSPLSIYTWVRPWLWSSDFWGNVRFNDSMLEDIEDFADWLISELGLTDNSTHTIGGTPSLEGYTLYKPGIYYVIHDPIDNRVYLLTATVSYDNGYQVIDGVYLGYCYINNQLCYYWVNTTNYSNIMVDMAFYDADFHALQSGSYPPSFSRTSDSGFKYTSYEVNYNPYPEGVFFSGSREQFYAFMTDASITIDSSYAIITGEINLPTSDPSYTTGDSVIIIDGEPIYQQIDWNGEVTISNLPAVVSTGTVSDPQLIEVWRPISSVLEYSADAMAAIIGIMYELPEEVIIPIYAVMGSVIILGVIKLMREH